MHIEECIKERVFELMAKTQHSLSGKLGFEYLSLERKKVVARMQVDERTRQPFGVLHGGASVALAESVASVGGWLNVDHEKESVVGLEINANHVRSVREGYVTATATPLHCGRKTHVWDIRIEDEAKRLVCVSRCTLAVISLERGALERAELA